MSENVGYSMNASSDVQTNVTFIVGQLEGIISDHETESSSVLGETVVQGAVETLQQKSVEWTQAADLAREIVDTVRSVMEENDEIAQTALTRARGAAENI